MSSPSPKVWFITGSSTGFGLELAKELLAAGYAVSATLRSPDLLADLRSQYPDTLITPRVDVTKPDETGAAVRDTVNKWGRIDVLVNNAGYGLGGMIEDVPMDQVRDQFETNVFGAVETIRAVLPEMRAQKSGLIFNISSIVGYVAYRGGGFYAATKHALEAISEALSLEVAPFGIKVVTVAPGPFRTDFAGRSYVWAREHLPEYDDLYATCEKIFENMNGTQAGDPVRAAKLLIEVSEDAEPPLRLPLGKFADEELDLYVDTLNSDRAKWREKSLATDFDS